MTSFLNFFFYFLFIFVLRFFCLVSFWFCFGLLVVVPVCFPGLFVVCAFSFLSLFALFFYI